MEKSIERFINSRYYLIRSVEFTEHILIWFKCIYLQIRQVEKKRDSVD